ncbi:MAG: alpha/beta fold hydrolase [Burkholderiaceae bacterium]
MSTEAPDTNTVALNIRELGDGPVLLLLHGLFGSSRNWVSVQKALAEHYHVVSVDLRNHGESGWHDEMNYAVMAQDISNLIASRGWEQVSVLGHSMGGKVAITLALRQPPELQRLIVADIAPVVYAPHHREFIQAMLALDLSRIERRSDADRQLASTIAEPGVRAFLLQNLVQKGPEWFWRFNLKALDESLVALGDFPAAIEASRWNGPVCVIRGGASDYITTDGRAAFDRYFESVEHHALAGAGHWLHAEQPAAFIDIVRRFMEVT